MARGGQRRADRNAINGWINLDKPAGMTSTQAVGAVKRLLKPQKIGHAGTLDPLATGVLPLALGEATKTVSFMMDAGKEYRFTVRFGERTDTDDAEGKIVAMSDFLPSDAEITRILPRFTGEIEQMPPAYSALKINGQRAYDLARAGEEVVLEPRQVRIDALSLAERPDAAHAVFEATCGKGTYIRSLARDLAQALGTEGHVTALRRTRVGGFLASEAISLDFLQEMGQSAPPINEVPWILPPQAALDDIPALPVDHEVAGRIRSGQTVFLSAADIQGERGDADRVHLRKALCRNRLVALVECAGRKVTPVRVFKG